MTVPTAQTRLHSRHPELAERILRSPPDAVRRLLTRAARIAIENARLEPDSRQTVARALEQGLPLAAETRHALRELRDELDNAYLDVQDQLRFDEPLPPDALTAFHRARAIVALLLIEQTLRGLAAIEATEATEATGTTEATEATEAIGAAEAIYEVIASSDHEVETLAAIAESAAS